MNRLRRLLLNAGGLAALVSSAALLRPSPAKAAGPSRAAFEAKSPAEVLKGLGADGAAQSADIVIKAPDIAENGSVVPIEVTSRIAGTRSIALIAEGNPFPLVAQADLTPEMEAYLSTRIKLGQTSVVRAVVRAGDRSFIASREIRVTIGGCGG